MTIKELAQRAKAINIPDLKMKAVKNKEQLLTDLQKKQIRQGMDANNSRLIPLYPAGYGKYKSSLSTYHAPPGVPDLFLTGGWSRGIRMKLQGSEYLFDSTDSKDSKLTAKYQPYGLNTTTLPQAMMNVTNEFNRLVKTGLGL